MILVIWAGATVDNSLGTRPLVAAESVAEREDRAAATYKVTPLA